MEWSCTNGCVTSPARGAGRVNVRFDQAGDDGLSLGVDDARLSANELLHVFVGAHRGEHAVPDGDGLGAREAGVDGHDLRRSTRPHRPRSAGCWASPVVLAPLSTPMTAQIINTFRCIVSLLVTDCDEVVTDVSESWLRRFAKHAASAATLSRASASVIVSGGAMRSTCLRERPHQVHGAALLVAPIGREDAGVGHLVRGLPGERRHLDAPDHAALFAAHVRDEGELLQGDQPVFDDRRRLARARRARRGSRTRRASPAPRRSRAGWR